LVIRKGKGYIPLKQRSFEFTKPDFRLFVYVLMIIGSIVIILEASLHIPWLVSRFPAPAPGLSYAFPEVGLKFQRYFALENVNCLFFGSSMVDKGIDPKTIEDRLNQNSGKKIKCMNFGLSGAMVESSSKVSRLLLDWQKTDLMIIGVSPIEFNEGTKDSRFMTNLPVFEEGDGFEADKWMQETFRLPWFYYGLLNRKDRDFIRDQKSYNSCLTAQGLCVSNRKGDFAKDPENFLLHDFHLNQVDLDALEKLITYGENHGTKIIIFEMPIKASYFPVLVEGGETMYERRFVEPVQEILQKHGLSMLRTQNKSAELLGEKYWTNENHLNYAGAKEFSSYLANQILERGDW
jgi:hypothetical protein